jgi:hypothetical protein
VAAEQFILIIRRDPHWQRTAETRTYLIRRKLILPRISIELDLGSAGKGKVYVYKFISAHVLASPHFRHWQPGSLKLAIRVCHPAVLLSWPSRV